MGSDQRILIITDVEERHAYFVNSLIAGGLPICGFITGAKQRRRAGPANGFDDLIAEDRDALRAVKKERKAVEAFDFKGQNRKLDSQGKALLLARVEAEDGDINAERFVELIHAQKPSLVAVMGATILRAPLLESGPVFVNLHTGLSPYYRGGRTNMWPILEGDYGHFGATVHRIAASIDGGDIYASRRVLVRPRDTYASVNARAIKAGTAAMVDVLKRLIEKPDLPGVPQWTEGKLFHDKDYTPAVARTYLAKCEWFMAEHLRRQARGELPDLRLID